MKWIDVLTRLIPSMKTTFQELDAFFDEVIEEHKTMKSSYENSNYKKDFMDILLQLQQNSMLEFELTDDNIKAILLVSLSLSSKSFLFL